MCVRPMAVFALLALLVAPKILPAQSFADRILSGDWVWTADFFSRDPIFAYAGTFVEGVRARCPGYSGHEAETRYLSGYLNTKGIRLVSIDSTFVDLGLWSAALRTSALSDAAGWVEAGRCADARLEALMDNAHRLLTGKRPAKGHPASTLMEEKVAELGGKHVFDHTYRGMQSPGMMQLGRDFDELPGMILECHYDEDPGDRYREVQYYWTYSLWSWMQQAPGWGMLGNAVLNTFQRRLQEANGPSPVTHPFTQYGWAREECPSERDGGMPIKTIYAPRTRPTPPVGPVSPPTKTDRTCPSAFYCRNRHFYEYGPVPEHFVPDWPDPLPADWVEVRFFIDEGFPGSVEGMVLERFSMRHAGPWSHLDWQSEGRTEDADLVLEDISAARESRLAVVRCKYAGADVLFWYDEVDYLVRRVRLRQRVPDHPLLRIGDPLETCPPSRDEALAKRGS